MKDNIVPVDVRKQYTSDMERYTLYTLYERIVPGIDGLLPVQRRILYAMWNDIKCISPSTKRKSANTVGMVMAKYHSHGDCKLGDTKLYLLNSGIHTMEELYNAGITTFESFGINETTLKVEPIIVHDLRIGQYTNKIYHIQLSNGAEIKCTSNDPIMLKDGSYVQAQNLTPNMILNTRHYLLNHDGKPIIRSDISDITIDNIYVQDVVDKVPMYDFTSDTTHNMLFPMIGSKDTYTDFPMVCMHNSSIYGSCKGMTNWFEIKEPLINYDSNSGSLQGGPQAAMRYTESYLSKFSMDVVVNDLIESRMVVDWSPTFDNHTIEPDLLPVKVPLLLVNGAFGITVGVKVEMHKHSLNDVIDATIDVLRNPNAKVVLIPDPCQRCEIVEADWKNISNLGFGYFIERGIVDIEYNPKTNQPILHIRSTPDLVFANSVMEKIEDLVKENKLVQIQDIQDHSTEEELDILLILKKGSDAEYVKQVLYKNTSLQDKKRVNMQVMVGNEIMRMSYKAYIVAFLEFRRNVKFRLYNARLQKAETRLHTTEIFIKILESGDVEKIIHAIRNQKPSEEAELVRWLMKKLNITDVQAKFVLNTEIKRLSKGNLSKYKEEQKQLKKQVKSYMNMITKPELIDKEIEQELLDIKAKYGKPRRSIIISEAQASNIPQGTFKIVVSEYSYIKKMQPDDNIKLSKGDSPKCVTIGDNSKDLLLFDEMGKVFKLPIYKIAFTDKNSPGIDIRTIIKKLTANIVSVMYVPILEDLAKKISKNYIVVVTKSGLIKKMDLNDILSSTTSGIIYSKLGKDDNVCDVVVANNKSDIIIYNKSKALRISMNSIPHLKRATMGVISLKSKDPIDGISVITSDTKNIIVVTSKGRFNMLPKTALERTDRNKAGSKVIKLNKGDSIKNIFTYIPNTTIKLTHPDGTNTIVNPIDIPMGSSVSTGVKLTKDVVKAELVK